MRDAVREPKTEIRQATAPEAAALAAPVVAPFAPTTSAPRTEVESPSLLSEVKSALRFPEVIEVLFFAAVSIALCY